MRNSGFAAAADNLTITQLLDLIDKADIRYHRPGMSSILTDNEYDILKLKLREFDPTNDRLTRVGSPYSVADLRKKVTHNIPMGSLDNTDDGILGLQDWIDTIQKKLGYTPELFASLKIDGGSICATYENGRLIRVATRGNGEVGDDITVNGMNFIDLPTTLPEPLTIDIRGEAILYKSDFDQICERDQIPQADRSNPRNVGNGILGRDDGKDSDRLHFIAFNMEGEEVNTEVAKMMRLKSLGFQPVPNRLCQTIDAFMAFYNGVVSKRDQLPFEIDGIVVVINEIADQKQFITSDIKTRLRPKYARAVKFPHKSNTTELLDVLLTVGHTRAIIPTAVLKEVRIGGVNVTHALLNNWDEIARLGIAIGDTVEVVLAGDIIPKIIRRVQSGTNRKPIVEPHRCPACGDVASREYRGKKGANTYCANEDCHAAKLARINQWIGTAKKGVGILGIGDTILKALWDNCLVQDPADLYTLTVDQIQDVKLDGDVRIGKSRATQIVANIASKRKLPLHIFLGSLGIDLLGRRRVKLLSESSNGKLAKLENWLDNELLSTIKLPGFGDTIREAIVAGINENRVLIAKLLSVGVEIDGEGQTNTEQEQSESVGQNQSDKPFAGFSFCLTGTRSYQDDIERLGGVIKSGVSKGLTFLVQADPLSTSNKTRKAEEYGTRIISLDYLKQAIDGVVKLDPNSPE